MKVGNTKRKYDSSKSYKWDVDDEFVLSGEEFSLLYHSLKSQVSSGMELAPLQKVECFKILENLFLKGIEEGIIKEVEKEEPKEDKIL